MSELKFIVKVVVFSVAILFVMQIRVGQKTIETHAHAWVQKSAVSVSLQGVAEGAAAAGKDAWLWASRQFDALIGAGSGAKQRANKRAPPEPVDSGEETSGAQPEEGQD